MSLINCEITLDLTWSAICVVCKADRLITFTIIVTKLYVPAVTLSTQDNGKLLQQLKPSFKRTINWNKYQSKVSMQAKNKYLDLINPSFQGVKRLRK